MCFDKGIKYLETSPVLDVIITSLLPRLIFGPKLTIPSISETTAGLEGLRASNNSVTRGNPPVISPKDEANLGILAIIWPDLIDCSSSTDK